MSSKNYEESCYGLDLGVLTILTDHMFPILGGVGYFITIYDCLHPLEHNAYTYRG